MWSALGKIFKGIGKGVQDRAGEFARSIGIGGEENGGLPVIGGTIGRTIPGGTPPFVATAPGTTTLGTVADLSRPALSPMPEIPAGMPVQTIGGDYTGPLPAIGGQPAAPALPAGVPAIGTAPKGLMGDDPRARVAAITNKNYDIGGAARDKNWTIGDKIASALVGWAQGGLAGGVKAATDRNFFEKMGDQNDLARLLPQIEAQQKIAQRDAQTENIYADNRRQDAALEDRREGREKTQQGQARNKLVSLKHFDPNDPTHAAQAKAAGLTPEDLKGWDDRDPKEKTVAGQTYRLNRETGKYEATNLPTDEAKTLTDYTVEMPSGETRTFRVPAEKAAGFATQMKALGITIASREREGEANRANQVRLQQLRQQMQEKVLEHQKASTERKAQIARELLELKRQYEDQ